MRLHTKTWTLWGLTLTGTITEVREDAFHLDPVDSKWGIVFKDPIVEGAWPTVSSEVFYSIRTVEVTEEDASYHRRFEVVSLQDGFVLGKLVESPHLRQLSPRLEAEQLGSKVIVNAEAFRGRDLQVGETVKTTVLSKLWERGENDCLFCSLPCSYGKHGEQFCSALHRRYYRQWEQDIEPSEEDLEAFRQQVQELDIEEADFLTKRHMDLLEQNHNQRVLRALKSTSPLR